MNKYQEALNHLEDETVENFENKHVQTDEERTKIINDVIFLGELVDKATPKKPIKKKFNEATMWDCADYFVERNACPACERKMTNKSNYCPNCGQALDWRE